MFEKGPPTQAKPNSSYTLVLVGDSMTQALGNADDLIRDLKKYYPNKGFGILNQGIGSTSILTIPDRLKKGAIRGSETLPAILDLNFDVILFESTGNNPLSNYPLAEGLKKQEETLDQVVKLLRKEKPDAVLIFVATISPSKQRYGEGVVNLTTDVRKKWAEERIAYIKNYIKYAQNHKILLINIYEKSLNADGDGNIDYIDSHDFIHPSPTGILFISQQIADFLFQKKILPL